MCISLVNISLNFFPVNWTFTWPRKIGVFETSRGIDSQGMTSVTLEIINNSDDIICIRSVESPLNVRWFEGPMIFVLDGNTPYEVKEVENPYHLPIDIGAKQKEIISLTFSYPNKEAKFSLKKKSWWNSSEYILNLK